MNEPMTTTDLGPPQRLGRRVARAVRELDLARLAPQLAPGHPLEADLIAQGLGHVPRVAVRHPEVARHGSLWLLGLVEIIDAAKARVSYSVPAYRPLLEHALRVAGASS